ncbi:hypothetical protein [Streptomyces sp. NPDC091416]|uniref:hypothetical protein n=1 Tax=Streptomyces sp. NPDC091416 TaxID=3366003 RepID=UPI0037FC157A
MNALPLPPGDETAPRNWTPAVVSPDHLRALTSLVDDEGRDRSVLVADRAGKLTVVTPDTALTGCLTGEVRLLATRGDLLDAGLRESWRAGRLTGPVVEAGAALRHPGRDRRAGAQSR